MSTHFARITHSARLRRVINVLGDGREHTTLQIMRRAHVCAVNAIVDELRGNGYCIICQRRGDLWYYQLDSTQQAALRA